MFSFYAPLVLLALTVLSQASQAVFPPAAPFYSPSFVNPKPPNITAEFGANWMQHKYDVNVNTNIASGYLYISPSQQKIRLDSAENGKLESSLFDFTNTTSDGLVSNVILAYEGGVTSATCSYYYVEPFIILLTPDILSTSESVYTGIHHDDLYGKVSGWEFKYSNVVVHFFLDPNNTLVRYDFTTPGPLRTFATTRFFNIVPGPIESTVFKTVCL